MANFDYESALKEGYTEDEIISYLSENDKSFDYQGAIKEGYSPREVMEYLSSQPLKESNPEILSQAQEKVLGKKEPAPERGPLEKLGRLGMAAAFGAVESKIWPYEIGAALTSSEGHHSFEAVRNAADMASFIAESNPYKPFEEWSQKDQEDYKYFKSIVDNPSLVKKQGLINPQQTGIRGLAQLATGYDTHPEGFFEHAANWLGYLKDPRKGYGLIKEVAKNGLAAKNLLEFIPGTKTLRSLGAATGLFMAEEGEFGPVGTMGMALLGDVAGHTPEGLFNIAKNPKKFTAELVNLFTMNKGKRQLATQLSEDFAKSGIKMDAGTLTNSDLVKMIQARVSQSGLTGEAADNFRKELSNQVVREYENIVNELGENRFENDYQAAEAIKDALKVNETSLGIIGKTAEPSPSLEGRVNVEPVEGRPINQNAARDQAIQRAENTFLNIISPEETQTSVQEGRDLYRTAREIKDPIQREFSREYTEFGNEVRQLEPTIHPELAAEVSRFVANNEGSLLPGANPAQAKIMQEAVILRNALILEGSSLPVSLDQLIKSKQTLSQLADWEIGSSDFSAARRKLVSDIDNAITRTLERENSELAAQYRDLNGRYTEFKTTFENPQLDKLFRRRNRNYRTLYNSFIQNPDKLSALEMMIEYVPENTPLGQRIAPLRQRARNSLNKIKRDYAAKEINTPQLTERKVRELGSVLGPEFQDPLNRYASDRRYYMENPPEVPLQRARQGQPLGLTVEAPQNQTSKNLSGRKVSEAPSSVRKKQYDLLKNMNEREVLQQMNTIEGIRRMRNALSKTPEGKKLFGELARYKLEEMIGNKMKDNLTGQIKLGKFSGLLKETQNKAIVKELLGEVSYNRLLNLQKNAGTLESGAAKFFNASKSGTTALDVAMLGQVVTGVLMGNPWMAMAGAAQIGGLRAVSNLLFDPQFIKYLEEAILTNNPKKFQDLLGRMQPSVTKALLEAQNANGGPEEE